MKYVKIEDYFNVIYGSNLELNKLEKDKTGINFVSRTFKNNGVSAIVKKIDNLKPIPKMTISVSCGGSVMESFLQVDEFYSGRDIYYLKPKIGLNKNQLLYYCICIRLNKYRYNFNRQPNKTLKKIKIPRIEEIPSWVNNYKISEKINTQPIISLNLDLKDRNWKFFEIEKDLFVVKGSKTTDKKVLEKKGIGSFPYITTKATNNGVSEFYNFSTEEGNVITIDSAVCGFASYQEKEFSASDHVEKLIPKFNLNLYIGLFITSLLNLEKFRYNYGIKCNHERIKKTKIKLPVDNNGNPDWKFMENYIKSLPFSSSLK
jgi:hypothetical protein